MGNGGGISVPLRNRGDARFPRPWEEEIGNAFYGGGPRSARRRDDAGRARARTNPATAGTPVEGCRSGAACGIEPDEIILRFERLARPEDAAHIDQDVCGDPAREKGSLDRRSEGIPYDH